MSEVVLKDIYSWNKLGYRVKKGAKAIKRVAGQSRVGLFSSEQVYKKQTLRRMNRGDYYDADTLQDSLDRFDAEYGHARDWY